MAKPCESRDQEALHEHPMVKELPRELQEIDEKARVEIRFYGLIAYASHIEIRSQYERPSLGDTIKMNKGETACYQVSLCGC